MSQGSTADAQSECDPLWPRGLDFVFSVISIPSSISPLNRRPDSTINLSSERAAVPAWDPQCR